MCMLLLFRSNKHMIILTNNIINITFISAYIQFDETSLFVASKKGYSEIVKELLKANANIHLANEVSCLMYNVLVL